MGNRPGAPASDDHLSSLLLWLDHVTEANEIDPQPSEASPAPILEWEDNLLVQKNQSMASFIDAEEPAPTAASGARLATTRRLSLPLDLGPRLDALGLSEREWHALGVRVGLGRRQTLEEAGEELGVTRERVRQIQRGATAQIQSRLAQVELALDVLEQADSGLWNPFDSQDPTGVALRAVQRILVTAGWLKPRKGDTRRLIVISRALGDARLDGPQGRWPSLLFAACGLPPTIKRHVGVRAEIERRQRDERERARVWSYEELIHAVLEGTGCPMHWRDIAERADQLGHRRNFSGSSLFNVVTSGAETLVRVAPGTYGLASWGLEPVVDYIDIIASVLKQFGEAVPFSIIRQRVNAVRTIKDTSLKLNLDLHPRFYRSVEGTYGLRVWLPPREKQTLRTARSLIEDVSSARRIDRAKEKGYDIDSIVAEDK